MNPNHPYSDSHPDLSRLTNNLSIPKLSIQSLLLPQNLPQTPQKPSFPPAENFIRFPPDRPPPSSEFTLDPIKKVKYNPSFQVEEAYQSTPPSSLTQPPQRNQSSIKRQNFYKNKLEDLPNLSYVKHFPYDQQSLPNFEINNSLSNLWANQNSRDIDLAIPALKSLHRNNLYEENMFMSPDVLELLKNQQFEQQLKEQQLYHQKMEQKMQYQYLKYLQQQQFDVFMQQHFGKKGQYKKNFEQEIDQQVGPPQLRNFKSTASVPLNFPPNTYNVLNKQLNLKQKASSDTNNGSNVKIRPIKEPNFHFTFDSTLHENTLKSLNVSKEAEMSALINEKNYKAGGNSYKRKWQNYVQNDQLENISQDYRPNEQGLEEIKGNETDENRIVQKRLMKKRRQGQNPNLSKTVASNILAPQKLEPRRKNKWQRMVEEKQQEPDVSITFRKPSGLSPGSGMNEETDPPLNLEESKEPVQEEMVPVQGRKNKYNRYEVENDENVDYNYLISVTITKDPAYIGSNDLSEGFVVVSQRTGLNDGEEGQIKGRGICVNKSYQADIPDLDLGATRTITKRKYPNLVWNPKAIKEDDLEKYFEDLGKILKSETINQERALKLLKRKNYKKEKVKVNVSKNEKFYSNFLVVFDNINCTLKTDNN